VNQIYAKNLVVVMLVAMGLYNLFRGIELLRIKGKRSKGLWVAIVARLLLGALLLAAPFSLVHFLRSGQA
jgi:hypothetical protein